MPPVRVRYAPSPTGYQHIGGIRTALFNYLFARSRSGKFILRIEDTDQKRFFKGALDDIFNTFKWLGIDYDEGPHKDSSYGPYFQSRRLELYQKHARQLVENGFAYECYCDAARLESVKKTHGGYDRRCRDLPENEKKELADRQAAPVIRFKAPLQGKTSFDDEILGHIEVEHAQLQDFVLLKSDGYPTYHLANIIDDHYMEISHVLRAQEWIPSTPNHILLYQAFGWQPPIFCHLPMVMGEDGQKLSKRHGATQVIEFKKAGYLARAVNNFIALLGWSYNDKDEIFSLNELEKIFDVKRINKAPAIFNYQKLKWFNGIYIRKLNHDQLYHELLPYYHQAGIIKEPPSEQELDYLKKIIPLFQERLELIADAPLISDFMFRDLPVYKTWEKIYPKKVEPLQLIEILKEAKIVVSQLGSVSDEEMHQALYEISKKLAVKAGAVFMPVRIAVTGIDKSPELIPVMNILGKDRLLNRLDHAITKIKAEKIENQAE